jgi:hypothetical protein
MTPLIEGGTVFEQRGQAQIVERFCDDRLRALWREVWRSLPATARDAVYQQLGDGERVLLVCDTTAENRPSHYLGQAVRIGAHLRLLIDYFNLDDYGDEFVAVVAAHEIAHLVAGHLGAPKALDNILTPARTLALAPIRDQAYPSGDELYRRHEAEATALAAEWGYPEPNTQQRRTGKRPAPIAEWTKRR